ncbi:MAG: aldo/keto reductase [Bacteroidales bacterium]|nr:aldo/keto reductase [Bacteroidales bacterium]
MDNKISRREAIRGMFFAGVGLATGGSLIQSCGSNQSNTPGADTAAIPWTEAPEGSKVDTRTWSKMGETLSLLGLGCMRLPSVPVEPGQGGRGFRAPLDQEAVNAMIDYAIAHGVNYFDTAPAYGESEVVTGKALSRHPRESYKIATKMSNMAFGPNANPTLEAAKTMFETSLKNLQVDYVDFFLLHNVGSVDEFNRRFRDNGVFDYILDQKAQGKIKHLGFSFHGSNSTLPPMLDLYDWEFVQIQLNYSDWKDMPASFGPSQGETSSEFLYNCLTEKGIPVLVMEPVKGGALASVSDAIAGVMRERHPDLTPAGNALTFVGSLPNVMITLSGMSNMEQLKENVSIFTDFKPFDDKEMVFMQTVADLYKSNIHIPCTTCSYCMPCPNGVNIPGNFKAFNTASDMLSIPNPDNKDKDYNKKKKTFLKLYKEIEKGATADACVNCDVCLPKCPQRIRIPDQLKMISDLVAKL